MATKINLSKFGNKLVLFTMIYYIISYILSYSFGITKVILYLADFLNLITFILAVISKKNRSLKFQKTYLFMFLFILLGIISNIINFESIELLLWGVRNNIRFFTFFYEAVVFLRQEDFEKILNIIKYMFFISIPLCIYQRFFVSYPTGTILGDVVGGIFFTFPGCNTPLNVILVLYSAYIILRYFYGKEKLFTFLIICGLSMLMAALAELKIYLFEFLLIITCCCLFCKKSFKNTMKIIIISFIFTFAISWFITFNEASKNDYDSLYTVEGFINNVTRDTGYDGTGDLNRLTGIKTINETIFRNEIWYRIFGIGMGNAEYTKTFSSRFYIQYKYLNYQWFHDIWLYIENGYIGLILFICILLVIYKEANKLKNNEILKNFSKISILLMLVLFIYNTSMRVESCGFLLYTILAFPYIINMDERKKI